MPKFALRHILPQAIRAPLWGNRQRWGLAINTEDPCWNEWQQTYSDFYSANQREGIGTKVNDAGYQVMSQIDMSDKTVLEIGAGDIRHIAHWQSKPKEYILADVHPEMMRKAQARLKESAVSYRSVLLEREQPMPLQDASVDVIVTFYSLEHLYPLRPYLEEVRRVLKPGGILIGAIPAEGGLAWGAGRFVTSRRWFKKTHHHRSRQNHLLGTSQFCRRNHRRARSAFRKTKHPLLAAGLATRARSEFDHSAHLSQGGELVGV